MTWTLLLLTVSGLVGASEDLNCDVALVQRFADFVTVSRTPGNNARFSPSGRDTLDQDNEEITRPSHFQFQQEIPARPEPIAEDGQKEDEEEDEEEKGDEKDGEKKEEEDEAEDEEDEEDEDDDKDVGEMDEGVDEVQEGQGDVQRTSQLALKDPTIDPGSGSVQVQAFDESRFRGKVQETVAAISAALEKLFMVLRGAGQNSLDEATEGAKAASGALSAAAKTTVENANRFGIGKDAAAALEEIAQALVDKVQDMTSDAAKRNHKTNTEFAKLGDQLNASAESIIDALVHGIANVKVAVEKAQEEASQANQTAVEEVSGKEEQVKEATEKADVDVPAASTQPPAALVLSADHGDASVRPRPHHKRHGHDQRVTLFETHRAARKVSFAETSAVHVKQSGWGGQDEYDQAKSAVIKANHTVEAFLNRLLIGNHTVQDLLMKQEKSINKSLEQLISLCEKSLERFPGNPGFQNLNSLFATKIRPVFAQAGVAAGEQVQIGMTTGSNLYNVIDEIMRKLEEVKPHYKSDNSKSAAHTQASGWSLTLAVALALVVSAHAR